MFILRTHISIHLLSAAVDILRQTSHGGTAENSTGDTGQQNTWPSKFSKYACPEFSRRIFVQHLMKGRTPGPAIAHSVVLDRDFKAGDATLA